MVKRRWMQSILNAATETSVAMPWTRGVHRARSIVRRSRITAKAKLAGA